MSQEINKKENNKLVVEDLLLQTDVGFKEKEDVYTLNMRLEGVKYPSSKMQILCLDEKVEFSIFPNTPVIPLEKIDDVAYYFSLINPGLFLGQFQLKNKAEGEMVPECSIICDTFDGKPSDARIQQIFDQLCDDYKKFINGVLLIQYDIMTPTQAAEVLKKG